MKKLALALLLTTAAGIASATPRGDDCTSLRFAGKSDHEVCSKTPPVRAPEIDAASAVAGLSLMIGGLAVLRGRRSKITIAKA